MLPPLTGRLVGARGPRLPLMISGAALALGGVASLWLAPATPLLAVLATYLLFGIFQGTTLVYALGPWARAGPMMVPAAVATSFAEPNPKCPKVSGRNVQRVVVEFPTMERLWRWYESRDYAEALAVRQTALTRRLLFVERYLTGKHEASHHAGESHYGEWSSVVTGA